jgi:hypothetical protein
VPAALAQTLVAPSLAPLGALAVSAQSKAVRFRQTQFEFTAGRMLDSDWGQVEVDPSAVRKLLGPSGGYVNVALFTPGSAGASWVVENLRVVPDGAAARDEVSAASLAAEGLQGTQPVVPMTATFDLRPGVRGSGRVVAVHAAVVVSEGLLPTIDRVWNLVQQVPPALFEVTPLVVNAEGDNGNAPPTSLTTTLQLGDPPQPVRPRPELPIGFATEVYQLDQPNMHSAKNQCLPMAMANVVGYLRLRYNHPPLSWPLPHHSSPGIGRTMSAGDVIFWQADPSISRTAQIDARTRRTGVYDFETGAGSRICQLLPGLFSYFATQGAPGMVSFTHQDSAAVIGAGNTCDTGDPTLPLGGYTSVQQGPNVTWAWLFQQLQQGRGVFMMFGRYDEAGKRTGGHALRVWAPGALPASTPSTRSTMAIRGSTPRACARSSGRWRIAARPACRVCPTAGWSFRA